MENLNDIIRTLDAEGRWESFLACFGDMKQEIVDEFTEGKINNEKELIRATAQLEILDKVMNIDNYARKWWEVKRK